MKLDELIKKEFPSQTENRKQWIIDTVKANQEEVAIILHGLQTGPLGWLMPSAAKWAFQSLHKQDKDALLLPNGILTVKQIEELGPDLVAELPEQTPIL